MTMRRYLRAWLVVAATLLLLVAGFNLVVDPYGLFRWIDAPAFNATKPTAGAHGAMAKAYQVLRVDPAGLILGNSRAEVGFDPLHPAWPAEARPVFNLALPGAGTSTSLHYLRHVFAHEDDGASGRIKLVVWGIDYMDFLVDDATPSRPEAEGRQGGRLLTNRDGSRNPRQSLQQLRDVGEATLALGTFLDSLHTLGNQQNPHSTDLTPLGFNPMRDYVKITSDEGYWAVFRQRDLANIKAYLHRPKGIFDTSGRSSPALEDLRQVLQICRQRGATLHLVIYPYHAHLLEIIRITGHWQAFEAWKRAIVEVLDDDARTHDGNTALLWDFSGFNEFTTEPVPPRGDRQTRMRWYWEAGHFKHELGDVVLERILAGKETAAAFGAQLTPSNVDSHIAAINARQIGYRRAFATEIEDLERAANEVRARR
jgi:hypothetical protein